MESWLYSSGRHLCFIIVILSSSVLSFFMYNTNTYTYTICFIIWNCWSCLIWKIMHAWSLMRKFLESVYLGLRGWYKSGSERKLIVNWIELAHSTVQWWASVIVGTFMIYNNRKFLNQVNNCQLFRWEPLACSWLTVIFLRSNVVNISGNMPACHSVNIDMLKEWCCMCTELQNQDAHMGESPSVAQMQNQQNRDQQYLAVRVGSGQQALNLDSASCKTDSAGNTDLSHLYNERIN